MTPIDIIKVINGTYLDRLIDSRDTNREAQAHTETTHTIIMTTLSPSRFCLGDRRPRWKNKCLCTNLYLRNMSCIACGSSRHTLADRKCTSSLEQNKTNLMSRNFPAYQPETIAQLHSGRIVSNIRQSQASNSSSETPISENRKPSHYSEGPNNKITAPSHICHFNITDELLDSMEEQRLENFLSIPELDLTMNEDEISITSIFSDISNTHS